MTPRLSYNIRELADATGIGRSKIYEEIKADRLRTIKVGSRTLVTAEAARAWLDAMPAGSKAA